MALSRRIRHVMIFLSGMLLVGGILTIDAQQIQIDSQHGKIGDTITFTVSLDHTLKVVDALGLELAYDPAILRYTGTFARGPLVKGFHFFDVHERQPGHVRIAGFTSKNAIATGARGTLLSLTFNVLSAEKTSLRIVQLVDDLAGLTTIPGVFTGETP